MARRARREDGQATTEVVLIVPVLLFVLLMVLQFGVWYHAQHVATAAAQEGVRAARLEGGTADAGHRRATEFLASAGPTVVTGPVVTASRDADRATVEIAGRAATVVPGISLPVRAVAAGPVERFRSGP